MNEEELEQEENVVVNEDEDEAWYDWMLDWFEFSDEEAEEIADGMLIKGTVRGLSENENWEEISHLLQMKRNLERVGLKSFQAKFHPPFSDAERFVTVRLKV